MPHYIHGWKSIINVPLIKADGSVIASLSHCTYVDVILSDGYKINISTEKTVENGVYLSGGLATEFYYGEFETVRKVAKEYIKEHLDYFKEQAFTMMPEAKNATRIDIDDPDLISIFDIPGEQPDYSEFFPR